MTIFYMLFSVYTGLRAECLFREVTAGTLTILFPCGRKLPIVHAA